MSTEQKLYWLTRLDNLQGLFIAFSVITGILLAIYFIAVLINVIEDEWDDDNSFKTFAKGKLGIVWDFFCIFLSAALLTPTKNEVIFIIAGGKTIDFISHDTSINKIPAQSTKMVSDFLQGQIKKLDSK